MPPMPAFLNVFCLVLWSDGLLVDQALCTKPCCLPASSFLLPEVVSGVGVASVAGQVVEELEELTGVKIWGACKDLVGSGATKGNWLMTKEGENVKDRGLTLGFLICWLRDWSAHTRTLTL